MPGAKSDASISFTFKIAYTASRISVFEDLYSLAISQTVSPESMCTALHLTDVLLVLKVSSSLLFKTQVIKVDTPVIISKIKIINLLIDLMRICFFTDLSYIAFYSCPNSCSHIHNTRTAVRNQAKTNIIFAYLNIFYFYLKEAFLLLGVPKFSYKSRERVRNEKVYVVDVAFVSERSGTFSTENTGWRLENTVYVELLRRYRPEYADVFYYRDKQWEVDFVIAKSGKVEQLVQVSYDISAEKTLNREINALLKAATKFHCENLLLINFDEDREVEKNGYTIRMIPAAEWLTRQ